MQFNIYEPEDDLLDEPTSSEPFSLSLFTPDVLGYQPPDATDSRQTAPYARMQSNDVYEVPNDAPGATQAVSAMLIQNISLQKLTYTSGTTD
jgi:hypothetical protein